MSIEKLNYYSDWMTIFTGILVFLSFFGIYKIFDLVKIFKFIRNVIIIKKDNIEIISTKRQVNGSEFDKDYIKIENTVYWIKNHRTLKFIMKNNDKATDQDYKKQYFELDEFMKLEERFSIDLVWETI